MSYLIEAHSPSPSPFLDHGWTPERKALFLDRLAIDGNARAACRAAGLSAESAYRLRRRDPLFARGWAAAVVLGRENCIQVMGDRAIEGVEEPIHYRGELIGTRRRYDSRLLLAHLARLDRLADEEAAGADAGRFDELVACIASGGEELPPARQACIDNAAVVAAHEVHDRQGEEYPDLFDETQGDLSEKDEELLEALQEECDDAAGRAAREAAQAWDRRVDESFAAIDALLVKPRAPLLAGLPRAPFAASEAVGPIVFCGDSDGAVSSFPCTLSDASTSALARSLAATDRQARIVHTNTRSGQFAPQARRCKPARSKKSRRLRR